MAKEFADWFQEETDSLSTLAIPDDSALLGRSFEGKQVAPVMDQYSLKYLVGMWIEDWPKKAEWCVAGFSLRDKRKIFFGLGQSPVFNDSSGWTIQTGLWIIGETRIISAIPYDYSITIVTKEEWEESRRNHVLNNTAYTQEQQP